MKKFLILIPCCSKKRSGGDPAYSANDAIFNHLSNPFRERLLNLRREIFTTFSIPLGEDFGIAENKNSILYLEAYKRYSGRIYQEIRLNSWEKIKNNPQLDLVIVSALYGLIRYNEWIRDYNRTMQDKIGTQKIKTWWRNNKLYAILRDYIIENNISDVYNFLSIDYNDALKGDLTDLGIELHSPDFAMYRSGSNSVRGHWINNFIQNF